MSLIIRERDRKGNKFVVELEIDGKRFPSSKDDEPLTIEDPFSLPAMVGGENRLEWYFEKWLHLPMLDTVRAEEAVKSIADYGVRLFRQLFPDGDIRDAYVLFRDKATRRADAKVEIVAKSPAFGGLHWEAMWDPRRERPLSIDLPLVRVEFASNIEVAEYDAAAPVRVLVVTARPHGQQDVPYRTISRPLLDALESDVPVVVELLRPGTYRALAECLERRRETPYHIVHFDLHGMLLKYDEVERFAQSELSVERHLMRFGRRQLEEFDGLRAFLFFEPDRDSNPKRVADPVSATEIAGLMKRYRVPLVILNACQSAKQKGTGETSAGAELTQNGAVAAVAMAYSVTVSAASKMMPVLYRHLFQGAPFSEATRRMRVQIHDDRERDAYYGSKIMLEDWILPVLYQREDISLKRRDDNLATMPSRPPEPRSRTGTFIGRDIDILNVERRLLQRNALGIHGFGGVGKTTLLRYLGHWWQRTSWVSTAVFLEYDKRSWKLFQILNEIAKAILSDQEMRRFRTEESAAKQDMLMAKMGSRGIDDPNRRPLLVLDNLEATTGDALTKVSLSNKERQDIGKFLSRLAERNCFILFGSRGPISWLTDAGFNEQPYQLRGLEPEAASELVGRILKRDDITGWEIADHSMQDLLKALRGHPLSLEVVIPELRSRSPKEILDDLAKGDIADPDAGERTRSIPTSIDYSYAVLSPSEKDLLDCLLPFRSVAYEPVLSEYKTLLVREAALRGLAFAEWEAVIERAKRLGLLQPCVDRVVVDYLDVQPLFSSFLALRFQNREPHFQDAIERSFRKCMRRLADFVIAKADSSDPEERSRAEHIIGLEFGNLREALRSAILSQESVQQFVRPISRYYDVIGEHRGGADFGVELLDSLERYPYESNISIEIVAIIDDIAQRMVRLGRFDDAEARYLSALGRLDKADLPSKEKRRISATILFMLSVVTAQKREFALSRSYVESAREINQEFGNMLHLADCRHQLAVILYEMLDFLAAADSCKSAIELYCTLGSDDKRAVSHGQLGHIYFDMAALEKAEEEYRAALEIFERYGDSSQMAMAYYSLGRVALERGGSANLSEAEELFRKALAIKAEESVEEGTALNHQQLGALAERRKEYEEAERNYIKAIELFGRADDYHSQSMSIRSCVKLAQVAPERRESIARGVSKILKTNVDYMFWQSK